MSGITGIGTTFNLPNYHGELFAVTPSDTPLLSAAGGIGGGGAVTDTIVEWQKYDLRDAAIRPRLEGADAPTAEERVRGNVTNRLQIFQEQVATSYTKQAATDRYSGSNSGGPGAGPNPIRNEHSWQIMQSLKQVARDVNYSFWNAVRNDPSDNTTARQMAGLLSVISSNAKVKKALITGASAATDTITVTHDLVAANKDKVVFTDVGASTTIVPGRVYWVKSNSTTASFKISATDGGAAITVGTATVSFYPLNAANTPAVTDVNGLLQQVFDSGGITEEGTATLFVGSGGKLALTAAYASAYGKVNPFGTSRNVGGVAMDTIVTDFGTLNIKVDRALPQDALAVVSMEQLDPVFLNIPDKGVLFEEALAKTGSADKTQIYGEIGLKYGNEAAHGVMRGFYV